MDRVLPLRHALRNKRSRAFIVLSSGLTIGAMFFVARWRFRVLAARKALVASRLAAADASARERFPIKERIEALDALARGTEQIMEKLADGLRQLSLAFGSAGAHVQEIITNLPSKPVCEGAESNALADFQDILSVVRRSHESVTNVLKAWCRVGEAKLVCSEGLLTVSTSVANGLGKESDSREVLVAEACDLWRRLLELELSEPKATVGLFKRLWRRVLGGSVQPSPSDIATHEKALEESRSIIITRLQGIGQSMEIAVRRGADSLGSSVADVRQPGRSIYDQLALLQDGSSLVVNPKPRRRQSALVQALTTREGREKHREAEAANEAEAQARAGPLPPAVEPSMKPPVEAITEDQWRVRGVYEHQVLKIGLRILDTIWPVDGLESFPRGKDGAAVLFRERLLANLISGDRRLQEIAKNDIAAAQRDIHSLSLRQLMRLRVRHIDFIPSGCGSNTVNSQGDVLEAFLSLVDRLLFQKLGEHSARQVELGVDVHRLGREALFFVAAAAVVTASKWWCWWPSPDKRVFFNAEDFVAAERFPVGSDGVLEIMDLSKRDSHEPTGKLRWFDWRVSLVTTEALLSTTPPQAPAYMAGDATVSSKESALEVPQDARGGSPLWRGFLGVGGGDGTSSQTLRNGDDSNDAISPTSGAAIGDMSLSVSLLANTRQSLRRVSAAKAEA
eukprot:TRINITY_DN62043_c0_g1_i1.p1 TRINITY_DN62043_c0_g1~~TRINITY_DN62043_c0_g1_i1.p1  ORF type:complete len:679 (+),score=113.88 TRINITY_DN62043_c0_g1_i1:98-2134(+)